MPVVGGIRIKAVSKLRIDYGATRVALDISSQVLENSANKSIWPPSNLSMRSMIEFDWNLAHVKKVYF